jgi:hypothetical protein
MTSLSILYNINPLPFAICVLTPSTDLEQQGSSAEEELHEVDTSIPTRRKKNRRKDACRVVIKEVTTRLGSGNLLVLKIS